MLASGLPTSEGLDEIVDLEELRSVPLPLHHRLDLFIGVFSTANNFKRRMAVRRAWMQYPAVKAGAVAVRFFVGLVSIIFHYFCLLKHIRLKQNTLKRICTLPQHKNQIVNEELWTELQAYRDIQLMPFVDYYSLITWKTVAICIFGVTSLFVFSFFFLGPKVKLFFLLSYFVVLTDRSCFSQVRYENR